MAGPESGVRPNEEGRQGELPLQGVEAKRQFTEEELKKESIEVFTEYVKQALPVLFTMVKNGEGKEKLDAVGGRPGEKRMVIDLTAYHLFKEAVKKSNIPSVIFSEEDQDYSSLTRGEEDKSDFIFYVIDPTENSSPYAKGVKGAGIFDIGSSFNQDGKHIAGFAIDIEAAQVIMSVDGKNFLYTYEMIEKPNGNPKHKQYVIKDPEGKPTLIEEIFPSQRKTLNDPDATFYTFMGEEKWARLAIAEFLPKLLAKLDPKTHCELSRGGSHIYPFYLANGRGEGYAISSEPFSEVGPALVAARNANLILVSVKPDGAFEEITINPRELIKNPKLYTAGFIPFLVTATAPGIRDEIIAAYVETEKEKKADAELQKLQEARARFSELREEEFNVFLASYRQPENSSN